MGATRNIMSSALFSLPFLEYQPVNISNGEPAITAANLTKQTMLGAPFTWAWNRGNFSFNTTGDQNYTVTVPNFGFLEKVWVQDEKGNVIEIKIVLGLAAESHVQRPASIAAQQIDDDSVLFRLNALPDKAYTVNGFFQLAAMWMSSMASSWTPIPDYLSYIYDWGFLSNVAMLTKDARFPIFAQRFTSHLLGAQDGLTATQRNIFLGNWTEVLTAPQRAQANVQQGTAARQI
jgi:hypothetical protein